MLIWSATQVTNKNSALLPVKDSMLMLVVGENAFLDMALVKPLCMMNINP